MAVRKNNFPFFKLNGGLNTEASPLNIPETDALSLNNTRVNKDASVQRRGVFDFIGTPDGGVSHWQFIGDSFEQSISTSTEWVTISDLSGMLHNLLFVVSASTIRVYDVDTLDDLINPTLVRQLEMSDIVDSVNTTETASFVDGDKQRSVIIQDGNNVLVINPGFNYLMLVNYDENGSIVGTAIRMKVRDVDFREPVVTSRVNVGDFSYLCIRNHTSLELDNKPEEGENWKTYWVFNGLKVVDDPEWATETDYVSSVVDISDKLFNNTSTSPGGRRIAKILNPSGRVISSVKTACMASGRLWASGWSVAPNTIYISQVVDNDSGRYGRFYQFNDPFSFDDSTVIDSDGVELVINAAGEIISLVEFAGGVLVFATNGVWRIYGNPYFTPTSFSIDKISTESVAGPEAVQVIDNYAIMFGASGIFEIKFNDKGVLVTTPINEKIATYWRNTPVKNRQSGWSFYDRTRRRCMYFFNDETKDFIDLDNPDGVKTYARTVLIYDMELKSWYIYHIENDEELESPSIVASTTVLSGTVNFEDVVDEVGEVVTDESLDAVTVNIQKNANYSYATLLIYMKHTLTTRREFAFGIMEVESASQLQDFSLDSEYASSFDDHMEFAYQDYNDILHKKTVEELVLLFKRTETGALDGNNEPVNPGGCLLGINWNWSTTGDSAYYDASPTQVYFPDRYVTAYMDGSNPGNMVVKSKVVPEGTGNVLSLRFSNDGDKPWYLYGYHILVEGSGRM